MSKLQGLELLGGRLQFNRDMEKVKQADEAK